VVPTVLRIDGHRFFFYSQESNEPPHIHVQTAERAAKFWLEPVSLGRATGYNQRELGQLTRLVQLHRLFFLEAWNGHFDA
jgi:hypothetical protein